MNYNLSFKERAKLKSNLALSKKKTHVCIKL